MKTRLLFWSALYLALAQVKSYGDSIFNTFGPNDSYDPGTLIGISWDVVSTGNVINMGNGVAASFSVGAEAYSLTSVTLALVNIENVNNLSIKVVADSAGAPTG